MDPPFIPIDSFPFHPMSSLLVALSLAVVPIVKAGGIVPDAATFVAQKFDYVVVGGMYMPTDPFTFT